MPQKKIKKEIKYLDEKFLLMIKSKYEDLMVDLKEYDKRLVNLENPSFLKEKIFINSQKSEIVL